jgi:mono/diheme cytochrome c family protein
MSFRAAGSTGPPPFLRPHKLASIRRLGDFIMRSVLAFIGALYIAATVAALVFVFGGFYNVSAAPDDPAIVKWALEHVRDASVDRHAQDQPPVSMEDAAIIQAGARAFYERGCVNCHGGPGVNWAKFSEGLRPDPPDLKDAAGDLEPREVFWIVKNGINMTGMPSFGKIDVPDREIWSIVAFVKKLPSVSDADFKTWIGPAAAKPPGSAAPPVSPQ